MLSKVAGTTQILLLSPMTPKFTIHNSYMNTSTTVTTIGFDPKSVQQKIPKGTAAYVKSLTVNGVVHNSTCHFDFYDTFRVGGEIVLELTSDTNVTCHSAVPESISTGGFASLR
jgi:hypothetical protein